MRSISDFHTFYRDEINEIMQSLEENRKGALFCLLKTGMILAFICLGIGIYLKIHMITGAWNFPIAVLALIVWVVYCNRQQRIFTGRFKALVMPEILRFIHPGLYYLPDCCTGIDEFNGSGLFRSPDRYMGKDYVYGCLDRTSISFSLVDAQYKTENRYTDDDGNTRTDEQWHTIFRGIFFSADFNKWFTGYTCVLPDRTKKIFGYTIGAFFQSMSRSRGQLIKLEDPEFNRYFVVYGSDQVSARYILTPGFMKRLVELREKMGCQISISFSGTRVYIAIPAKYDIFEPRFFRKINDPKVLFTYFYYLHLVTGIVEDLNLNTRIWNK